MASQLMGDALHQLIRMSPPNHSSNVLLPRALSLVTVTASANLVSVPHYVTYARGIERAMADCFMLCFARESCGLRIRS